MKYEQLHEQAAAAWSRFDSPDVARVLVGMGTCGRAAGGDDAMALIGPALSRLGVEAIVSETGCLGLCYAEPLVELQKPADPAFCTVTSPVRMSSNCWKMSSAPATCGRTWPSRS